MIAKIAKLDADDNVPRILITSSSTDWITKMGLIAAARSLMDSGIDRIDDD